MTSERVAASDATRRAPALSVHNLGKRFGDRIAFQDVSFEIGYGTLEPVLTTPIRREEFLLGKYGSNHSLTDQDRFCSAGEPGALVIPS